MPGWNVVRLPWAARQGRTGGYLLMGQAGLRMEEGPIVAVTPSQKGGLPQSQVISSEKRRRKIDSTIFIDCRREQKEIVMPPKITAEKERVFFNFSTIFSTRIDKEEKT